MKKFYYLVIIGTILSNLYSEDSPISLTNKINISKQKAPDEELIQIKKNDSFDDIGKINPIIPKSFYIEELGDKHSFDLNRNELLNTVDSFFIDIKRKRSSELLNTDFKFIFETVFEKLFNDEDNRLDRWLMGYPVIDDNYADLKIELYFKKDIYIGYVYLVKDDTWLVSDLQIDLQERGIFDPSSQKTNLY